MMLQEMDVVGAARRVIEQEFRHSPLSPGRVPATQLEEWCPAIRVLPQLEPLLMECHWRPVREYEGAIRRMIIEQAFVNDCGECAGRADLRLNLERQVQLVVRALEHVRKLLVEQGEWSDLPATPQMFG